MSATASAGTPATPPTIIEKLESVGHECLTALEHGAAWLVGTVATADTGLHALEATSPLVAAAIAAGEASAVAHGVPVTMIENAGDVLLSLAKQLAAGLAQPAAGDGPKT